MNTNNTSDPSPDNPNNSHTPNPEHLLPRSARKTRRPCEDSGLPQHDEELAKLARSFLENQAQLYPDLLAKGVIPKADDTDIISAMTENFKFRHRRGELDDADISLLQKGPPAGYSFAAGYGRFSCDNSDPSSIRQQYLNCQRRAQQAKSYLPWCLVYADFAISGLDNGRRGYQSFKTIALAADHNVSILLADEISRFARQQVEWLLFLHSALKANRRILTIGDGYDSANESSDVVQAVSCLNSNLFIRLLRGRVMRGMKQTHMQGRITGKPPLGYTRQVVLDASGRPALNNKGLPVTRLAIDPATSAVVREIFQLAVNGLSAHAIAGVLKNRKADGYKGWDGSRVTVILNNQAYVGVFIWNKTRIQKDPQTNRTVFTVKPRSEWLTFTDPLLRIIPDEQWQLVRKKYGPVSEPRSSKFNSGQHPEREEAQRTAKHLFGKVLICGSCQRPLRLFRSTPTSKYVHCPTGHRKEFDCELTSSKATRDIEYALLGYINSKLLIPETLADLLKRINEYAQKTRLEPNRDQRQQRNRLDKLRWQIDLLVADLAEAENPTTRAAIKSQIATRETEYNQQLATIRAAGPTHRLPDEPLDEVKLTAYMAELRELLASKTPEAAEVLRDLTGPISITQKRPSGQKKMQWLATFTPSLLGGLWRFCRQRGIPVTGLSEFPSTRILTPKIQNSTNRAQPS